MMTYNTAAEAATAKTIKLAKIMALYNGAKTPGEHTAAAAAYTRVAGVSIAPVPVAAVVDTTPVETPEFVAWRERLHAKVAAQNAQFSPTKKQMYS